MSSEEKVKQGWQNEKTERLKNAREFRFYSEIDREPLKVMA